MNDLYRAPESELSEDLSYKPALGWKILFFVLLPLEIWSQYDTFLENTSGHPLWWLLLSMGIYLFYYIGLFGLAFAKKIFNRRFWQGYLPVMMLTDCFEIFSDLAAEGLHDRRCGSP